MSIAQHLPIFNTPPLLLRQILNLPAVGVARSPHSASLPFIDFPGGDLRAGAETDCHRAEAAGRVLCPAGRHSLACKGAGQAMSTECGKGRMRFC